MMATMSRHSVVALAGLAWASVGLAQAPGPVASPIDPAAVVTAIAANPPRTLSQLAAIVGPLPRDRSKWDEAVGPLVVSAPSPAVARARVELSIDVFHLDPTEVEDPSLGSYVLRFTSRYEASRSALAAAFPAPNELARFGRPVWRFGDLYLSDAAAGGSFSLSWYSRDPEFAIPVRSEAETDKLVEGLAFVAKAGFTRRAVEERFGRLTYDPSREEDVVAGETWQVYFEPPGAEVARELVVVLERPLPGAALLPKLGISSWRVVSGDTHLQGRHVVAWPRRMDPVTGYSLPSVEGYVLSLEVRRDGLIETEEDYPGSPVWRADDPQVSSFHAFLPRQ